MTVKLLPMLVDSVLTHIQSFHLIEGANCRKKGRLEGITVFVPLTPGTRGDYSVDHIYLNFHQLPEPLQIIMAGFAKSDDILSVITEINALSLHSEKQSLFDSTMKDKDIGSILLIMKNSEDSLVISLETLLEFDEASVSFCLSNEISSVLEVIATFTEPRALCLALDHLRKGLNIVPANVPRPKLEAIGK